MDARSVTFQNVQDAIDAIDALGSSNSVMMGTRALHFNVLLSQVPAPAARLLKKAYNEVGAEVAISHSAFYGEECAATEALVMGTLYQHREVRRILAENPEMKDLTAALEAVLENAPEAGYTSEDPTCGCCGCDRSGKKP
jgi:hypothetical protein